MSINGSRFDSLERDNDADHGPAHSVVYKWEEGNSSWTDAATAHDDDLIHKELLLHKASEREKLRKAKLRRITPSIRRGLIRFLLVALDCSSSAEITDYRPASRFQLCKEMVKKFTYAYFDQNPISQLGLIVTRNRLAERITDLSGNPASLVNKLAKLQNTAGLASLQNTISLAISLLQHVPTYGNRELLIIYNSISTCDPGDIFTTINQAVQHKLKIHIVCLAGEVFICKKIAEMTGGLFHVSLDSAHLDEIFQSLTVPPPTTASDAQDLYTDFVYLGFPAKTFQGHSSFVLNQSNVSIASTSYICPRCNTRTSELPTDCKACLLQLNSSANIARSYHHLFPVPNYSEATQLSLRSESCKGCLVQFSERNVKLQCPQCSSLFCVECDLFIHESLHNCPGCTL